LLSVFRAEFQLIDDDVMVRVELAALHFVVSSVVSLPLAML